MKRPTLALSRPLLDWLREDPRWAQQPLRLRAFLAWRAALGSLNARLSAQQPTAALRRPLFIAGPWRSGSTVMHELLSAALGWPTPRTWQCLDPCAFRLQKAPRAGVSVARPMDGLELGPLSPQEDEFALLALGVDSAYRAFWQPQRLDELDHTLDPAHWLQADWLPSWEAFAGAVQGEGQRLLLKSPNHSFRLPAVLARFPDAQIVWMLRDGAAVFASNRKMWSQMFATHGLGKPAPGALDRFLAQALARCAELLETLNLPSTQLAFCRQEQLQQQPQAEVERLLAQLGLQAQADSAPLQLALDRVAKGRVEHYPGLQDLSEEARTAIARFDAAQCAVLQSRG
jgi:hypothetical protein